MADNAMMRMPPKQANAMMQYVAPLDAGGDHRAIDPMAMSKLMLPGTFDRMMSMGAVGAGSLGVPSFLAGGPGAGAAGSAIGYLGGSALGLAPNVVALLADLFGNKDMTNQVAGNAVAGNQMKQHQPMQYDPQMPYIPR